MKHISNNNLLVVVLLAVLFVPLFYWATLEEPVSLNINNSSIRSVDIEFRNNKMNLNVHLNQPASCKQIIKVLGIQSITVRNRLYSPSCSLVDGLLMRIVYSEAVTA